MRTTLRRGRVRRRGFNLVEVLIALAITATLLTATLAALIGAGGLGEPILSGLNLNDPGTILQGALPAALLALLVQLGFDVLERRVVPRGLRLYTPDAGIGG